MLRQGAGLICVAAHRKARLWSAACIHHDRHHHLQHATSTASRHARLQNPSGFIFSSQLPPRPAGTTDTLRTRCQPGRSDPGLSLFSSSRRERSLHTPADKSMTDPVPMRSIPCPAVVQQHIAISYTCTPYLRCHTAYVICSFYTTVSTLVLCNNAHSYN